VSGKILSNDNVPENAIKVEANNEKRKKRTKVLQGHSMHKKQNVATYTQTINPN